MKKSVYNILILIFAIIFLVSAVMIFKNLYEANKSAKDFDALSDLVLKPNDAQDADSLSTQEMYGALYQKNSDFAAWIKIDGTNIDYPVMQSKGRIDYYLRRNFDKKYSYYGTPYINEDCEVGVSDNIVIYGHNMKNGTMFSALEEYKSKDFYTENSYIRFDTLEEYGYYQIAYVFTSYEGDGFAYHTFINADSEDDFNGFLQKCSERALYDTGVSAEYGDRLITLSTCEYSRDGGRLVIVAKKIN